MSRLQNLIEQFARGMARPDALVAFTLAGALVGLLSSAIILLFRLLIDSHVLINLVLRIDQSATWWHTTQLAVGGILLWAIYYFLKTDSRRLE